MPSSAAGGTPSSEGAEMPALIDIRDLRVTARIASGSEVEIVRGVTFSVEPGRVLGLIGESGSGKTTVALATMGYARYGCRISSGSVRIGESEVTALSETELRALRGRRVAYIAQSAAAAFNPARTILAQVIEPALIHGTTSASQAKQKAIQLFRTLAVPDPETIGARYPHQVSGGQLQRLMAAMALITDPEVVIFDEPTTALDVTTQIEVLKAFKAAIRERNTTGIYVTHDLAVIAQIADSIAVLRDGAVQETGETRAVVGRPHHDYTRSLLAAAEPAARPSGLIEGPGTLLSLCGVTAGYGGIGSGGEPRLPVLRDISLSIHRGAALGVIGESGCGKSTLARTIAGLTPLAKGTVAFAGQPLAPSLRLRTRDQLRRIQLVFQSADTALNPTMPVEAIIGRPLTFYFGLKGAARAKRVRRLLDLTRLPSSVVNRLPGDLSGGQKQRASLARALAAEPDLLLCDEVTSSLDTVVAAAILDLLSELRRELSLTYMFISHDLKTVRAICDDVMVLYAGRLAELMPATELDATRHHHPYSQLLFSSVPELEPGWLERQRSALGAGVEVDFAAFQSSRGCAFFPRCPSRIAGTCDRQTPPVKASGPRSRIACHLDP
jgi:peptide/nickel transport system ATP-binding protein